MRNKIIPYNPALKQLARELRKNGTMGEALLWKQIKNKLLGVEFHRQVPIDNYIVDFYCHELMLAIEIDGKSHEPEDVYANDIIRQEKLEQFNIRFLRFTEMDVRENMRGVIQTIANILGEIKQSQL